MLGEIEKKTSSMSLFFLRVTAAVKGISFYSGEKETRYGDYSYACYGLSALGTRAGSKEFF